MLELDLLRAACALNNLVLAVDILLLPASQPDHTASDHGAVRALVLLLYGFIWETS